MKRAAADHPKLQRLQKALGLPRYVAIGLLETLWHFCARYAPQGDIGRWMDEEISDWIGWEGEPANLIEALVSTRWLEPHPTHRLIIHDWHEHADEGTKVALKRNKLEFVTRVSPQVETVSDVVATCRDMSRPPEPEPVASSQSQEYLHGENGAKKSGGEAKSEVPAPAVPARRETGWERSWPLFLDAYPRRSGDRRVKDGREIFKRLLSKGESVELLLGGVRAYAAWAVATGTAGTERVKQIPTFLNQRSWEETWEPGSGGQNGQRQARDWDEQSEEQLAGLRDFRLRQGGFREPVGHVIDDGEPSPIVPADHRGVGEPSAKRGPYG